MRRFSLLLISLALLLATSIIPMWTALPTGIGGTAVNNGCNCHSSTAADDVTLTLSGMPNRFQGGESYTFEILLEGGPEVGGENAGGFSLKASHGQFRALDDSTQVLSGGESTHTESGNDKRNWTIEWEAPRDDTVAVEFTLLGNAVDGDGEADGDDRWTSLSATSKGQNFVGGPVFELEGLAWSLIVGLILAIVLIVVLVLWKWLGWGKVDLVHWLTTTNHKDIGLLYLWTTLLFALIGLALSVLIRLQLVVPENDFMTGGLFNEAVTMHGAVMVLFAVSPMSFAFANYIVPLQIGARDMAFPRLNALSYWALLFGGLTAASGFFFGGAADAGWTFYSPLTSVEYTPGAGVSLAGAGLVLLILSVSASTINFLVTILRWRVPSMPLMQMPMFSWNILFTVILMLIVFPALLSAVLMLVGDRVFGTLFFDPSIDGTTWWLHIFWFFGHPEVYVVLLPGLGMAMEIVPTFTRRPLYGRRIIIWSLAVACLLGLLVWAHHMFITGIDPTFRKIETIGTELVSVPFGLIYLCLLATFYKSKPDFSKLPLAFTLGAVGIFLIGGITGVYLASVAMDVQLRGTYFIVAHFHYTMGSVAVMTLGGLYYWYPKMFGRMLDRTLGWWHFWMTFIGINLTFIPLFGLWDMPRRIYVYQESAGWAHQHLLSTIGSAVVFLAQCVFAWNFMRSLRHGEPADADPWKGSTFEWATTSPPQLHNFDELPVMGCSRTCESCYEGE